MNAQERLIKLDDARDGQTLARPIEDSHGQVLMASGSELTESAIQSLRRRQVEAIWVRQGAAGVADTVAAESARRTHHRQRLARLFRNDPMPDDSNRLLTLLSRYRAIDPP